MKHFDVDFHACVRVVAEDQDQAIERAKSIMCDSYGGNPTSHIYVTSVYEQDLYPPAYKKQPIIES